VRNSFFSALCVPSELFAEFVSVLFAVDFGFFFSGCDVRPDSDDTPHACKMGIIVARGICAIEQGPHGVLMSRCDGTGE
jgi:hypothetical protein